MAAGIFDILIEQGSTFERTINVTDSVGDPVDLSDVTSARGQVRQKRTSTTAYDFTLAVTNASGGVISWEMDAVTTASIDVKTTQDWVYDIELVRTNDVERLLQGIATISPEVTK